MADFELPPRRSGEDYNPFAAPGSDSAVPNVAASDLGHAERIRNEHIGTEASIRAIGGLQIFGAVFAIIGSLLILSAGGNAGPAEIVFLMVVGILGFVIGKGLRDLKNWARITAAIMSIPGILSPITWIILYYLLSKKGAYVCTPEYAEIRAMTPHIKYKTSIIVKFFVFLLFLVFILIIVAAISSSM